MTKVRIIYKTVNRFALQIWFLYDRDLRRERVKKGLGTHKLMSIAEFKGTVMKIRKTTEVFLLRVFSVQIWEICTYFLLLIFSVRLHQESYLGYINSFLM